MKKKYIKDKHRITHNVLFDIETGCWEWQLCRTRGGYGRVYFNGVAVLAHRLSYVLFNGEIPSGNMVLHSCDNPNCCNPNHLWAGTQCDNMKDMRLKGRGPNSFGEKHPNTLLTSVEVLEIVKLIDRGTLNSREIGVIYGVSRGAVTGISSGKNWSHLTGRGV